MPRPFRLALCLLALLPLRPALADDNDTDIKVDVVVDLTDAGRKVPRPTPAHPAYFYPVTRGYALGEGVVPFEKAPPPTAEVQHLIAVALAEQGYQVATKKSPPTLILLFWWGYKAPVFQGETNGGAAVNSKNSGLPVLGTVAAAENPALQAQALTELAESGLLPTNVMLNGSEMEDLVFGSKYDRNTYEWNPSIRLETLNEQARVPRYYVTISALDFAAATQKRIVILWTAHMSTSLEGHTLDQVLPSLIAAGAPLWGKDTGGAIWPLPTEPLVPMGRAEIGTPHVRTDSSAPGSSRASQ